MLQQSIHYDDRQLTSVHTIHNILLQVYMQITLTYAITTIMVVTTTVTVTAIVIVIITIILVTTIVVAITT